jgi:hypothetical protein
LDQQAATQPVAQATGEAPKKRSKGLLWIILLAAVGGGGFYAYDSGMLDDVLGLGPEPLPEPPVMPGSN